MKAKSYLIKLIPALVLPLLFSCELRDELKGPAKAQTGKVELQLLLQEDENAKSILTRLESSAGTDNFFIQILNAQNEVVKEFPSYASLLNNTAGIELPAGDYKVRSASYSGEMEPAALNKPYYWGEKTFTVKANENTVVENVCERLNAIVNVVFGEDFLNVVKPNYAVTLTNNQGVLTLSNGQQGIAYFAPSSFINVAIRATTTDGRDVYKSFTVTNNTGMVRPTDAFEISLGIEEATPSVDPDPNPDPGPDPTDPDPTDPTDPDPTDPTDPKPTPGENTASLEITIDVTMNGRDEDIIITYPDPENPDPGVEVKPGEKPVISGAGTKTYTKAETAGASVKVAISTAEGIQNLNITIDSPFLTPEELGGLGIPQTFDLANLTPELNEGFQALGLIGSTPIKGAKSTSFDISTFIPLLTVDTHRFHISVTDVKGEKSSETLTIIITN